MKFLIRPVAFSLGLYFCLGRFSPSDPASKILLALGAYLLGMAIFYYPDGKKP